MNPKVGDRVFTPFSGTGTVVDSTGRDDADPYHTLVELDDPENNERINPRWFMTDTLQRAPEQATQLSLLLT